MGLMKNLAIEEYENRRRGHKKYAPSERTRERYLQEWTDNMVTYWQERIAKLRAVDTGNLYSSIEAQLLLNGAKAAIRHAFPAYGKYVDDGTGREFTNTGYVDSLGRFYASARGGEGTWNSGQLPFLLPGGEEYRAKHGLDKPKRVGPAWGGRVAGGHPREKKPWYFSKYYASRMVLNELEQAYFGNQYLGMMTTAIDEVFKTVRVL